MGLHLVEFTWFHYALVSQPYILSVALVLTSRWTGVTRYDALWCPDFPPGIAPRRRFPFLGSPFIGPRDSTGNDLVGEKEAAAAGTGLELEVHVDLRLENL